jgi:hypothetical protein
MMRERSSARYRILSNEFSLSERNEEAQGEAMAVSMSAFDIVNRFRKVYGRCDRKLARFILVRQV